MEGLIRGIVVIVIGYLLGSFLPAHFIAQARGFDIRARGTGNPGIANAAETMGYSTAALVALYDLFKAPLAVLLSSSWGNPMITSYAAGVAAFVGHRAPFYLGFRGGEGLAAAVGIGFYAVALLLGEDPRFAYLLVPLMALMAVAFVGKLEERPATLFVFGFLPLTLNAVLLYYGLNVHSIMFLLVSLYIIGHRIHKLLAPQIAEMTGKERRLLRRKWLRPFATLFAVGVLALREATLILLATVFLAFVALEIVRFRAKGERFPLPYKPGERARISSMVMFLFAALLVSLLFPAPIASLALMFVILGDLLAWSIGVTVGGPGFLEKTWSGTVGCFAACFTLAVIYSALGLVPLPIGILGALGATAVELAPLQEDNFVMPVASAIVMTLVERVGLS